jgi:hypothetical protein
MASAAHGFRKLSARKLDAGRLRQSTDFGGVAYHGFWRPCREPGAVLREGTGSVLRDRGSCQALGPSKVPRPLLLGACARPTFQKGNGPHWTSGDRRTGNVSILQMYLQKTSPARSVVIVVMIDLLRA